METGHSTATTPIRKACPMSDEQYVDADAQVAAGQEPPSQRVPLSRDRVVTAAVEFIEDQGLPALTMRRLGEQLGVEAMSLYRYVPSREELLDAVVEHILVQMQQDTDVIDAPEHGWQDFLQRWVWAQGAGQNQSDALTAGTSAFVELALVYPGADNAHGSGSAYPSTPGHFDDPNACAP